MAIGILVGHFVPLAAPTLQQGEFVGVSLPIGKVYGFSFIPPFLAVLTFTAYGTTANVSIQRLVS